MKATSSSWTISPLTKAPTAEAAIKGRGAWVLFLPPYSPDLNPIKMVFSKPKVSAKLTPSGEVTVLSASYLAPVQAPGMNFYVCS